MNAPSYPIRTLIDMARIPEDAQSRFLAELPLILSAMRAHLRLMQEVAPDMSDERLLATLADASWVDEDLGDVSLRIDVEKEDGTTENLLDLQANHKSKAFSGLIMGEPIGGAA